MLPKKKKNLLLASSINWYLTQLKTHHFFSSFPIEYMWLHSFSIYSFYQIVFSSYLHPSHIQFFFISHGITHIFIVRFIFHFIYEKTHVLWFENLTFIIFIKWFDEKKIFDHIYCSWNSIKTIRLTETEEIEQQS